MSALAGARGTRPAGLESPNGSASALALVDRPEERLSALERLELLTDPGSLRLVRTRASSRRMGERARPGDGILAGHGSVDGRQVYCYAQDPTFAGGSLGEVQAQTLVQVMQLARRARVPLIGFVESAGARMQEGLAALQGYGEIFREHVRLSGLVPQIAVVCGPSAGGASYGPALNDFVIMSDRASMFLTGPAVVAEVTGEELDASALGGPKVHERNGVCHLTAPTRRGRCSAGAGPARLPAAELRRAAAALAHGGAARCLPERERPGPGRKVYDVRDVARALVDGGRLLEISPRWARNVVCALARLDGRSIGILASQPSHLGGVLDAAAAQKAARFVRTCNSFGLPMLVLVDTPGFMPGSRQEREGVIRHGAKLVHAFAELTVPSVTVVLRKAYGGAFIAMNSKALGADYYFAWPGAELGVMGAGQAVGILHRRELAAAADPVGLREQLSADYAAQHLGAETAMAEGFVDEVIAPSRHPRPGRLLPGRAGRADARGHPDSEHPAVTLLEGRRLLITGVINSHSIAFATARRAQELGAEIVLSGFGRARRMTERAAAGLDGDVEVLELDVERPEDIEAVRAELERRWGALDGVVHAIAYAPADALGGAFLETPRESALQAFSTSAFSLKSLTAALAPLLEAPARGASWASTSTPASPGPRTTGWGSPRPPSSPSRATWRGTSGAAGSA